MAPAEVAPAGVPDAPASAPPPAVAPTSEAVPEAPAPAPAAPSEPPPVSAAAPAPTARPAVTARSARPAHRTVARAIRQEPQTSAEDTLCAVTGPNGACVILSGHCDIQGTDGDDTLTGTPAGEIICGFAGDDLLTGGDGEDTLVGGPGDDRIDAEGDDDCIVHDDTVDDDQFNSCRSVDSFEREQLKPPPTDTGGPVLGEDQVGGGVVSETTGAGQVYVALARYLQAGDERSGGTGSVIADVLEETIKYEQGQLRFLVRCSYEGDGRIVLTALDKSGKRVKLGSARFHCAGEGDDPIVTVQVPASGRRLLSSGTRVRAEARVLDSALAHQPAGSRQTLVLTP